MFIVVIKQPILRNSTNVIVDFILLSRTSSIITFDAAPSIVKFPAIVDYIASVSHSAISLPLYPRSFIYLMKSFTNGTLLSN